MMSEQRARLSAADVLARVALRDEHMPHPDTVVTFGESRITMLTPRLVRLEWAPSGAFDDRPTYAFPRRFAAPTPFHFAVGSDTLMIDTGTLRLTRKGSIGPFSPQNLSIDFELNGASISWRPGDRDPFQLRGARRTLDGCRGEAALDHGLLSRSGWALHDDSTAVRFDPETGWVQPRLGGDRRDWYFFGYGHDYTAALADYARYGGRVPLIARWALGAWWSRYWAYSDQDLRALVGEFAANAIPLDVLVIDMDWHTPQGWTGYTWNRQLFPDPVAFLAWLHTQGLRVTLNLHPAQGVQPHEEAHPAFVAALGRDPAHGVPFRSSDPAFVRGYFELLHHPLEDQGVDFWWLDWQQGRTSELPGLDPLPWLNHLHYRDMHRHHGRRPMIFSRWGGLGNHRYPIGFSGDTYATWEALRYQPYFTATAANVLYGWWSHDIGGHFGACEPELFVRWVQLGALSPILRLHAAKAPDAERRPWAFPPHIRDAARRAIEARYELLPYLYTLARVHHEESLALCRPLYYSWPADEAAYAAREQFLLGDQLLVAPIVQPADQTSGLAPADVWIPPGEWIERTTGEWHRGPAWIRLVGDINSMPQFVRAGAILPLAPVTPRSHHQPADQLTLAVFPGPEGSLRIYEDDGVSEHYRAGQYEWTPASLRMSPDGCRVELAIGPIEGRCEALPRDRAYTVRFRFFRPPQAVLLAGATHMDWRYEPHADTLVVNVPPRSKLAPVGVTVVADQPLSLLGESKNAALRSADARRLLGRAEDQNRPAHQHDDLLPSAGQWATSAERLNLLDAALAGASPAHRSALARLGGPFVRVYDYTTPEDASRALGTLVIAAPRDGTAVAVTGVWRMIGPEGPTEYPFDLGNLHADTVVVSPFAWAHDLATRRWALDLRLHWRGRTLSETFSARTLFPTIGAWRTSATAAVEAFPLAAVLEQDHATPAFHTWDEVVNRPEDGEFQNLTEPFNVPLSAYAEARPTIDLVGYAATNLRSPDARLIRIAYQSPRLARVFLNGEEVAQEFVALGDIHQASHEWSRTAPARLRPGANRLVIVVEHPAAEPHWRWFLHIMALGQDGLPVPDLVVEPPAPC